MKKIYFTLICSLLVFSCKQAEENATESSIYDDWDLICLDFNNTEKRVLISSKHDTLSITNFVWKTKENPDGEKYTVRDPDSRMKIKLDKNVKQQIVSNAISLFKNPQPFQHNVTDYVEMAAYLLIQQKDAKLVYHFPYSQQSHVILQSELVDLFKILSKQEKQHTFEKVSY